MNCDRRKSKTRLVWVTVLALAGLALGNGAGAEASTVTFVDVSAPAGIDAGVFKSWGVEWADYDNDGWTDVFVGLHTATPLLYHSNGDGTFTNVTSAAGLALATDRHGCAWGDYDADTYLDLYCATGACEGTCSRPNLLYRNNANGTFTEVAGELGVSDDPGRGRAVNWFDYDGDGRLDLYVGNETSPGHPSRLFRNVGGTFEDVSFAAGVADEVNLRGTAWADYDDDRDADLLVVSASSLILHQNGGDGTFGGLTIPDNLKIRRSAAWGDYDNDGDLDLFVAGSGRQGLYKNLGGGILQDVTRGSGISGSQARLGVWGDLDNDGDLDLFVVNRYSAVLGYNAPDALYRNDGDGSFKNIAYSAGVSGPTAGSGESAAWADYDKDGFLDLFVTNGEGNRKTPAGPLILFRNTGNANHWLELKLRGTFDDALGYGAKVWVLGGGKTQLRQLTDGVVGYGQSEEIVHFGLGSATTVDELIVEWPNGTTQQLTNLAADQVLTLTQP